MMTAERVVRARRRIVSVTFRTSCAGHGVPVPPAALNLLPPGPTNTHEGCIGPQPFQRETNMTIKSKIAAALAVVTLAGGLAIPTSSAQAAQQFRRMPVRITLPTSVLGLG